MPHVIGIDLGTTNSVVACLEGGRPLIMPNAEGSKTTPSIVHYVDERECLVGDLAKRQRLLAPDRTIYSIKRFIGCRWSESKARREGIAYELTPGDGGETAVRVDERRLLPEEILAEVLKKMKETAENYLDHPVSDAVITCPAYYNDSQRQATKKAAELAGLDALRIINEPTAAALAYGLDKDANHKIAVFDFGGGTFDISILELDDDLFEVKSTCGDTFLGGDTIDHLIVDWLVERVRKDCGLEVADDPAIMSRIAETAEKAKCELSSMETTTCSLPFLGADAEGPKHLNVELTREAFEGLIAPVLERLREPCEQAVRDAGLNADDLGAVILVGGSTRIPSVRALAAEFFSREPIHSVNPDEAVAAGAAIQGAIMSGELDEVLLLDVTPLSLGIELEGGLFSPLIPRNSNVPTTAKKRFTTVKDNQTTVTVHVLQGERRKASQNRSLARFRLEGIAPAPRELPEIEVSFNLDANGILHVSAMDLTTGAQQEVRVESYQTLADTDADQIVADAQTHADEDRLFVRKLAVRRRIDAMQEELRRLTRRADRPRPTEDEQLLAQAFFRLEAALMGDDLDAIQAAEREARALFEALVTLIDIPQHNTLSTQTPTPDKSPTETS